MKFSIFCLLAVLLLSCGNTSTAKDANETKKEDRENVVPTDTLDVAKGGKLVLTNDIELNHEIVFVPEGVSIIAKGGVLRNGTLVGSDTKIIGKKMLFDHVTIKGSWNVPYISTDMFKDLSYDNALRDVIALSNDKIQNNIVIGTGSYSFSFLREGEVGIAPASNSTMRIEGTLWLKPNNFKRYYIVNVKGKNIHITGNGVVEGDKVTHIGKEGEWGMGVNFSHANKCSLSELTIRNCWGDCVYVGGESKDCSITECTLDNGRRQGISVTSGSNINIADCHISKVSGTAPGYAIDLEPNKGDTVQNINITNVTASNCEGGFLVYTSRSHDNVVKNIVFSKCTIDSVGKKWPLCVARSNNVKIEKCKFNDGEPKYIIVLNEARQISLIDNIIKADNYVTNSISDIVIKGNVIYGSELYPTRLDNVLNRYVNDNVQNNKVIKLK